jgi:hypothetical protein
LLFQTELTPGWTIYCSLYTILEESAVKQRLRANAQALSDNDFNEDRYFLTRILDVLPPNDHLTQLYAGTIEERMRHDRY